jgi:hypothetical protein
MKCQRSGNTKVGRNSAEDSKKVEAGRGQMNRLDRYRQMRALRRKFFFSFLMFFILLTAGISVADNSTNRLMRNENRISIVDFKSRGAYYEVSFMNQRLLVNVQKIREDTDYLWQAVKRILGRQE